MQRLTSSQLNKFPSNPAEHWFALRRQCNTPAWRVAVYEQRSRIRANCGVTHEDRVVAQAIMALYTSHLRERRRSASATRRAHQGHPSGEGRSASHQNG